MGTLKKLLFQKTFLGKIVPLFLVLSFFNCSDKCKVTNTYVYYKPVYSTTAQIKAAVGLKEAQPIAEAGKIYLKDKILFINEVGKGIHIINNTDPSNPKPLSFLNIPGNYDLAILGNTLYADSFVDLVAFDVSDLSAIKEINRIERLFNHYNSYGFYSDPQFGTVTDWEMVKTVSIQEDDCKKNLQYWGGFYFEDGIAMAQTASFSSKAAIAPTSSTGIGGSMSRFAIANNYLYALDSYFLDVVDVSNQTQPKPKNELQLTWQAETLFPDNKTLFVGTRSGMYIYNIESPDVPTLLSQYEHVRSCDPVVVEGDYAYVTLRDGNACGGFTNQLEVVNIKDLKKPFSEKIYAMKNPHGLGIDKGILFICDGSDGLKVYDATDITKIADNQLAHYGNISTLDIIPYQNIAMMIGTDGLYQYDYSDVKNIKLISKLPIAK
ncbi:MAG: LVIVD repeat-containing protein [Cyclobacteriaceae bacterium]